MDPDVQVGKLERAIEALTVLEREPGQLTDDAAIDRRIDALMAYYEALLFRAPIPTTSPNTHSARAVDQWLKFIDTDISLPHMVRDLEYARTPPGIPPEYPFGDLVKRWKAARADNVPPKTRRRPGPAPAVTLEQVADHIRRHPGLSDRARARMMTAELKREEEISRTVILKLRAKLEALENTGVNRDRPLFRTPPGGDPEHVDMT
jgi:hypothetical protein